MTVEQTEVTITPSKENIVEAALLDRRSRLLKWQILMGFILTIGAVCENINDGTDLKKGVIDVGILLCGYVILMSFYRRRFRKKIMGMTNESEQGRIKYVFTSDALILSSQVGQERLSWDRIRTICASSRIIVFSSKDDFTVPLPVSNVTKDLRSFIGKIAFEKGIKVHGAVAKRFLAINGN